MEPNGRPLNEILTDRKKKGKISVQYRLKFHGAGKCSADKRYFPVKFVRIPFMFVGV